VRWVECVQTLAASGVEHAVECGPGKVLGGMIKRIDKSIASLATDSPESMSNTLEALK